MAQDIELKIKAAVEAAEAAKSVGELRRSIKQLESIAIEAGDANQEAFLKATEAAGAFSDKIEDTKRAVNTFKGDTIATLSGGLGTLKKDLVNLDFRRFNEEVGRLAITAKGLSFGEFTKSIKGTTTAFAQLGKVLLTNPIFLLVAVTAAIILNFERILSLIDGVSKKDKERLETQKQITAEAQQQLDDISATEETLKKQGLTEEEILDLKIEAARVTLESAKEDLRQQESIRQKQIDAAKRNKEILEGILKFLTAPLQLLFKQLDLILEGLNAVGILSDETFEKVSGLGDKLTSSVAELVFNPEKIAEEGDKADKESKRQLEKLQAQLDGFENRRNAKDKERADKRKAERDKELQQIKQNEDVLTKFLESERNKRELSLLDEFEKERTLINQSFDERVKLAGKNQELIDKINAERLLKLEEVNAKEIQAEKDKQQIIEDNQNSVRERLRVASQTKRERELEEARLFFEQQLLLAGSNDELRLQLQTEFRNRQKQINDEFDAIELQSEQAKNDALLSSRLNLAAASGAALGQLSKLLKQGTAAQKAAALSEIAINTGIGFVQGLDIAQKSAKATGPGAALSFPIFYATQIAAVLGAAARARAILQVVPGGGGGAQPSVGGLGGGRGSAPTPTFSPAQFFGLGQQTPPTGGGQQDTRVFVVESDITNTQNRVSVIESRSTIG
jgi:hypothetical protein